MSGSGICWAICKSAPRFRQITSPAPHHSVFLQAGCSSCRSTNSVNAVTATESCFRVNNKQVKTNCGMLAGIWLLLLWTDCGSGEGGGLQDTPIEVVHLLLSHLLSPADSDSLGVSSEQKDAFFRTLTKGSDWLFVCSLFRHSVARPLQCITKIVWFVCLVTTVLLTSTLSLSGFRHFALGSGVYEIKSHIER